MVKINGGIYKDQVSTGNLRAFIIKGLKSAPAATNAMGADTSMGLVTAASVSGAVDQKWVTAEGVVATYAVGSPIPNTVGELVYRVLATRGTVVSIETLPTAGEIHVVMENATAWGFDRAGKSPEVATAVNAMDALVAELSALVGLNCAGVAKASIAVTDVNPNVVAVNTAVSVVETRMVFDAAAAVSDDDKTIVHGGNAHDQGEV